MIFFVILNVFGFFIMGLDKENAKKTKISYF